MRRRFFRNRNNQAAMVNGHNVTSGSKYEKLAVRKCFSLFDRKHAFIGAGGMSVSCHKQILAICVSHVFSTKTPARY